MLRSFAGLVYGVAIVLASLAVGAGGHGFATFFGVAGAPFAFFAIHPDKIGLVAIPLYWATVTFIARLQKAQHVFLALMALHYGSAILWLLMRRSDLTADLQSLNYVTTVAVAAGLIYLAGQILLWRDYARRS